MKKLNVSVKNKIKGFTLVELLAVIVILAIIMLIAIPAVLDSLQIARRKAFVEYVNKVVNLSEKKYLDGLVTGDSTGTCYIYDIKTDLGLATTGDYKGYVLVALKDDNTYQYWVLLYDKNYFLDAIEFNEFLSNPYSKLTNLTSKMNDLDMNYFANALKDKNVNCSSFSYNGGSLEVSDNKNGENAGTNCEGQTIYNSVPKNATGLYKLIAEKAYMDNVSSKYVTECSGINYKLTSDKEGIYTSEGYKSIYNGTGIYEMASTKDDKYPIYYFRGNMNDYDSKEGNANNVVFGGSCWKIIRTTSTGGIKMIYNGAYSSGTCGKSNLGYLEYNANGNRSLGDVSYMYGKRYEYNIKNLNNTKSLFGDTVEYSDGKYKLAGNKVLYDSSSPDSLKDEVGKQYTCFNESGECSSIYYIFKKQGNNFSYINLSDGEKISDALHNSFEVNSVDSSAKKTVDNWFASSLVAYQSNLEDTPYCNDRKYYDTDRFSEKFHIFDSNYGNSTRLLSFAARERGTKTGTVSLQCNKNDAFTVSSSIGNGALKYPVGLITYDEVVLAGGSTGWSPDGSGGGDSEQAYNSGFYLHDDSGTWTMSPSYYGMPCNFFSGCYSDLHSLPYAIDSEGYILEAYYRGYIKPVISLKAGVDISSGDGTKANPYVIK